MEKIIYTKFSNDRAPEFNVVTEMRIENGERKVRKTPYSKESVPHVENIHSWSKKLEKRFEKSGILVNQCSLKDNVAYFEYLSGETTESILDGFMMQGDKEGFFKWVNQYIEKVEKVYPGEPFKPCDSFKEVFGEVELDENIRATKELNIDMIFGNIIEENGQWVVIDYEWTFDFLIPIQFLFYRTAMFYLSYSPKREHFCGEELMRAFGISESEEEQFRKMEQHFQVNYVLKNHNALHLMYRKFGKGSITIEDYFKTREELAVEIQKNDALQNSTSWKLTKPLRIFVEKIRKS